MIGERLSDLADAAVAGALEAARRQAAATGQVPPPLAIIAMGRWGGRELNYASDLDALVVYRAGERSRRRPGGGGRGWPPCCSRPWGPAGPSGPP